MNGTFGNWLALSLCLLIIPACMIIVGIVLKKASPKKINPVVGYRTRRSMMNQDTWNFANQLAGKISFNWGMGTLIVTGICIAVMYGRSSEFIGVLGCITIFAQLIPLCLLLVPVERALKRTFDDDGNRREIVAKEEEK